MNADYSPEGYLSEVGQINSILRIYPSQSKRLRGEGFTVVEMEASKIFDLEDFSSPKLETATIPQNDSRIKCYISCSNAPSGSLAEEVLNIAKSKLKPEYSLERYIEYLATQGKTNVTLPLYPSQSKRLISKGFLVYECPNTLLNHRKTYDISWWLSTRPNSFAELMLLCANSANPQKADDENKEPFTLSPYGGWN